jgi:large subunit ribosomal protein L4
MAISVPCLRKSGDVSATDVSPESFRRRGRKVLLKEYAIMAEARRRVGSHSALTRGEVAGSTKKMYRQKGTGRARHGTRKVPQLRGGSMAFAKKPRNYGWAMPKQARRAALEAAIRGKLEDGEVRLVESFAMKKPKTRDFVDQLRRLEVDGSFLVVPVAHDEALWKSCRNVRGSAYRVVSDLNAYEVLRQKYLVLEEGALKALEERFANG